MVIPEEEMGQVDTNSYRFCRPIIPREIQASSGELVLPFSANGASGLSQSNKATPPSMMKGVQSTQDKHDQNGLSSCSINNQGDLVDSIFMLSQNQDLDFLCSPLTGERFLHQKFVNSQNCISSIDSNLHDGASLQIPTFLEDVEDYESSAERNFHPPINVQPEEVVDTGLNQWASQQIPLNKATPSPGSSIAALPSIKSGNDLAADRDSSSFFKL